MARKTAAQKAEEEQQKIIEAQQAALANGTSKDEGEGGEGESGEGEIGEGEGTIEGGEPPEGKQTTIVIGAGGSSKGDLSLNIDSKSKGDATAVTLRSIPGLNIKPGSIVKAPKKLIDLWVAKSWADDHEDALAAVQKDIENQKMRNPLLDLNSMFFELDKNGQPISEFSEG